MAKEEPRGCEEVRDLLSAFLEGDLEAAEGAAVERHLETCEGCAADLVLLRQALADLRSIPDLPAPAAILAGVREGIRPRRERWAPGRIFAWWPRGGFPVGAAATILVAFGIFLLAERFPDLGKAPAPLTESVPGETRLAEAPESVPHGLRRDAAGEGNEKPAPAITSGLTKEAPELPAAGIAGRIAAPPPPADRDDIPSFTDSELSSTEPSGGEMALVDSLKAQKTESPPALPATAAPTVPADEPPAEKPVPPAPSPAGGKDEGPSGNREAKLRGADLDVGEEVPLREAAPSQWAAEVPPPVTAPPAPARKMKRKAPAPLPTPPPPPAPAPKMLKKLPEKKALAEASPAAEEEDMGYYRKSLPPRAGGKMEEHASADSRLGLAESPEQEFGKGSTAGAAGQTEILTIVSFTEDEVRQVRESIAKNGGTLLEMENLDAAASQQAVLPYQVQIPDYRNITRGWQVRALVPAGQVEELVSSLRELPRLQVLERTQVPDTGRQTPGVRNVQINLIRQAAPAAQ